MHVRVTIPEKRKPGVFNVFVDDKVEVVDDEGVVRGDIASLVSKWTVECKAGDARILHLEVLGFDIVDGAR